MKKTLLACVAGLALHVTPVQAQDARGANIVQLACGTDCVDVVGTRSALQGYWDAFQRMGTTQFIGSTVNGSSLDAGSLLQAAAAVGAPEVDRFLRSGFSDRGSLESAVLSAFSSGSGANVSSVVRGMLGSAGGSQGAGAQAAANTSYRHLLQNATDMGLSGTAACDPAVASSLGQAAQGYVEKAMNATLSGDYAFSRIGGGAVSEEMSGGGMFGGSCIEKFMQGGQDLLFKPPQLSQLLSGLSQAFGSGGSGGDGCSGLSSPLEQITGSMPKGVFAGGGGFFPASLAEEDTGTAGFWGGSSLQQAEPVKLARIDLASMFRQ